MRFGKCCIDSCDLLQSPRKPTLLDFQSNRILQEGVCLAGVSSLPLGTCLSIFVLDLFRYHSFHVSFDLSPFYSNFHLEWFLLTENWFNNLASLDPSVWAILFCYIIATSSGTYRIFRLPEFLLGICTCKL